jgi:oxygen-independent coproporphyrinogen-3 oxidase
VQFTETPPLSLYVHLPWCEQKCPYCDFNSHTPENFDESAYVRRLIEDLQQDLPLIWGRQIISIFIGGGTPSLFSSAAIAQLLSDLRACLNLNPSIEITLEANPGSADESHFKGYRDAGINRLSIGIQSLNNDHLKALGRIHESDQALQAFHAARTAGFDNINIDLMYGLPGQSLKQSTDDIAAVIALGPEHISLYQLSIEPNTRFHHQPPHNLPDDDSCWDMQLQGQSLLARQGYQQYEISAYAQPGQESRHNQNYWLFGDYAGIGAGAHGKITLPAEQRAIRRVRSRQPQEYMTQPIDQVVSKQHSLSEQDLAFEFMLNALRLTEGFNLQLFEKHTGLSCKIIEPAVQKALQLELLNRDGNHLQPTALGLRFHNDLQALFLDLDAGLSRQVEVETSFN